MPAVVVATLELVVRGIGVFFVGKGAGDVVSGSADVVIVEFEDVNTASSSSGAPDPVPRPFTSTGKPVVTIGSRPTPPAATPPADHPAPAATTTATAAIRPAHPRRRRPPRAIPRHSTISLATKPGCPAAHYHLD